MAQGESGPNLKRLVKRARLMRSCLRCQRLFPSTGIGNRMCPNCQRINEEIISKRELS